MCHISEFIVEFHFNNIYVNMLAIPKSFYYRMDVLICHLYSDQTHIHTQ